MHQHQDRGKRRAGRAGRGGQIDVGHLRGVRTITLVRERDGRRQTGRQAEQRKQAEQAEGGHGGGAGGRDAG
jgi:hypothetical protein